MATGPVKTKPTELEQQQAEYIKKLEAMIKMMRKNEYHLDLQFKRLKFEHNNTKYELNALKQRMARNG